MAILTQQTVFDTSEKLACITLDLEDDWYFEEPSYNHLTFDYIDDYISLLSELQVPVSVFVVGRTIEEHPDGIKKIQSDIDSEFHLHSYRHDLSKSYPLDEELRLGSKAFESFFGKSPKGYRSPQGNLAEGDLDIIDAAGFEFDSSVFPSYRPGVYNNLTKPLKPHRPTNLDIMEIPIAATPWSRIPITQSYLKLLGRPYMEYLRRAPLPEVLIFDSHLQDYYRTASHDKLDEPLQSIHKRNLNKSEDIFRQFVEMLRTRGYRFVTISDIYNQVVR